MRFTENEKFVFETTGRTFETNFNTIGLSLDSDGAHVGAGMDNALFSNPKDKHDFQRPLTPEEHIELADFMIAQWQRFKEATDA